MLILTMLTNLGLTTVMSLANNGIILSLQTHKRNKNEYAKRV